MGGWLGGRWAHCIDAVRRLSRLQVVVKEPEVDEEAVVVHLALDSTTKEALRRPPRRDPLPLVALELLERPAAVGRVARLEGAASLPRIAVVRYKDT